MAREERVVKDERWRVKENEANTEREKVTMDKGGREVRDVSGTRGRGEIDEVRRGGERSWVRREGDR